MTLALTAWLTLVQQLRDGRGDDELIQGEQEDVHAANKQISVETLSKGICFPDQKGHTRDPGNKA